MSRPWQSSKVQPAIVVEAVKVLAKADYTYADPLAVVKTDRSGDTYLEWTFSVVASGSKIGTMTIWHNRFGAFAHFDETRKYPLN